MTVSSLVRKTIGSAAIASSLYTCATDENIPGDGFIPSNSIVTRLANVERGYPCNYKGYGPRERDASWSCTGMPYIRSNAESVTDDLPTRVRAPLNISIRVQTIRPASLPDYAGYIGLMFAGPFTIAAIGAGLLAYKPREKK